MSGKKADMKICEVTDIKRLSSLSAHPRFDCARCGSKAHEASSLCVPVSYSGGSSTDR
jgi:hypothetical protein